MNDPARPFVAAQADDDRHLELLAIFHYVVGGLIALSSSVFLIYVVMGLVVLIAPATGAGGGGGGETGLAGAVLLLIGGIPLMLGWATGACIIFAGRCLTRRIRHTLCMVAAGLACLLMPLGTALGIITLIVLTKPSIRGQFSS